MAQDNRTLGEVVRDARVKLKRTLRDVTGKLGITPSYLSDIENDRRIPSDDVLRRLAGSLELDYDELMARAGRLGDGAIRYMKRTPAAGVLFRRLADSKASPETLRQLLEVVDEDLKKEPKK